MHKERLKIPSPHRQIVRKSGNPTSSHVSFLHTCVAINQNELTVRINSIELGTFAAVMAPFMHDFCAILLDEGAKPAYS